MSSAISNITRTSISTEDRIDSKDILYLESERPKVEMLLRSGSCNKPIFLNDLHRIYERYFVPGFTNPGTYEPERLNKMLEDLYARYDQYKANIQE